MKQVKFTTAIMLIVFPMMHNIEAAQKTIVVGPETTAIKILGKYTPRAKAKVSFGFDGEYKTSEGHRGTSGMERKYNTSSPDESIYLKEFEIQVRGTDTRSTATKPIRKEIYQGFFKMEEINLDRKEEKIRDIMIIDNPRAIFLSNPIVKQNMDSQLDMKIYYDDEILHYTGEIKEEHSLYFSLQDNNNTAVTKKSKKSIL